jgi:hypothetical protein
MMIMSESGGCWFWLLPLFSVLIASPQLCLCLFSFEGHGSVCFNGEDDE